MKQPVLVSGLTNMPIVPGRFRLNGGNEPRVIGVKTANRPNFNNPQVVKLRKRIK